MYCSQCGKQLMENSKFCSYCGAKVGEVTQKIQNRYSLVPPRWNSNHVLRKLLKEVLGYQDDEIEILESEAFVKRNLVNNLTIDQAKLITEIFGENDFDLYLNDGRGADGVIYWKDDLGISLQEELPKEHYCDTPLVSRDHLADFSDAGVFEYARMKKSQTMRTSWVECPYCHSTYVQKLPKKSLFISNNLWGGGDLSQVGKNFHCNQCGADF